MSIRDIRQAEFADTFINHADSGILYLCPRFGKCSVAIQVMDDFIHTPHILVAYPDTKIKESWLAELDRLGYSNTEHITFTTHLSLHKYESNNYDLVVLDEIHLLSEKQLRAAKKLKQRNRILGLTGTMTKWTESTLKQELGLPVLARYPIDQAIEEGVITDYEIIVKKVPLDDKVKQEYKGKYRTEKQQFDVLSSVIKKLEKEKRNTKFMRFGRMRIIQGSLAKIDATREILENFSEDRILVFCGLTATSDKLGCPVYHSKKGEKDDFEEFAAGKGNHLAVVKIGNTGVTYKPLNKIIINYFDSNAENLAQKINRCMAMEYNTPDKKASIYIISSTEPAEQAWLSKALEFFDSKKIRYE